MTETFAETKLKRFLLYGSEQILYIPGCRVQYHHYLGDNLASLRQLITQVDRKKIFLWIKFIQDEKLARHIALVPLVLSECCKISGWKEDTLDFALTVIQSDKEFVLFCKFSYEILPDIGLGSAVKEFIGKWYQRRDYTELVELVSETPGCYGWSHRDIIKLGEVHSSCPKRAASFTYAMEGVDLMNQLYGNDENAKEIVDRLNRVEAFRNETDPDKAVKAIETYMYTPHTTNELLLKNMEVWKALTSQMDLVELLRTLPTLEKNGLLRRPKTNSPVTNFFSHICDRLGSLAEVLQSNVTPSQICTEHERWKNTSERFCKDVNKRKPVNQNIVKVLKKQMNYAMMKNVKKTSKNITVIIDGYNLSRAYCTYKRFIRADLAAAVATLHIAKAALNANLIIFKGTQAEHLHSSMPIDKVLKIIRTDTCNFGSSLEIDLYLSPENKEIADTDLFVVIGTHVNHNPYLLTVNNHRRENPRAPKFAFCSLSGVRYGQICKYEKDVLLTSGFDDKMCDIILAFSLL